MYNSKSMEVFLKKVQTEAQEAVEEIYAKHQQEFERRIANQMHPTHIGYSGMGTSFFKNPDDDYVGEKFSDLICEAEYYIKIDGGFDLPSKFRREGDKLITIEPQ